MKQVNLESSGQLPATEQWYDMKQAAKLIDEDMGRTKLFKYLRDEGFLMDNNEPYQEFINEGIFKLVLKDIRGRRSQLLFQQAVTLISGTGIRLLKKYIATNRAN